MTTFLSRLEAHSKFMGQMMRRCGVNPAQMAQDRCGLTLAAAVRACMACGRTESCRKWLAAAEREGMSSPPPFCPNAERFNTFQGA